MERLFSQTILDNFLKDFQEHRSDIGYIGDLSDFGNEIGISLGHTYPNMNASEIEEFIIGLRHGISLTNGTH